MLRAARAVDPATGFDGPAAIEVRGGRIASLDGLAANQLLSAGAIDVSDGVLLPGLVDLHAHPAKSGSKYGVDPDAHFLLRGTTTVLSQGDAGADHWAPWRDETLGGSRTRVRMALNLSRVGESTAGGCFERLEWADVDACVRTIDAAGDAIWGIAVNVSEIACGSTDPQAVMARALDAARATGRPLLFGVHDPRKWPMAEQLGLLRAGDVVTYCFRPEPFGVVAGGQVRPEVRAARERGVLFDVGHGMQSFAFDVAEAAIGSGFPPDTISTDGYAKHVGQNPPHDLPRTMAKLRAVGMPERDVLAAATSRPAAILGLAGEIGTLRPGACADLVVLRWSESAPRLVDVVGQVRQGGCWDTAMVVRNGEVVARGGVGPP